MTRINANFIVQTHKSVTKVELYLNGNLYELSVEDAKRLAHTLVKDLYTDAFSMKARAWNASSSFFSDHIAHCEDFST